MVARANRSLSVAHIRGAVVGAILERHNTILSTYRHTSLSRASYKRHGT